MFVILESFVKNGEDRLAVFNRTARSIIEVGRQKHPEHVFSYKGRPVRSMNNTAWKRARKEAGLQQVRIHDLKHTFGRRLRAAGVPLETRKVLLGHHNGDITTHSQYTQLIARRIREIGVYCEIRSWDISDAEIDAFIPRGLVLSGRPESVPEAGSPRAP